MKKTPWFSVKTPPVHDGLYETRYDGSWPASMRTFDNGKWISDGFLSSFGWCDTDQWRGLTEQAKEQT